MFNLTALALALLAGLGWGLASHSAQNGEVVLSISVEARNGSTATLNVPRVSQCQRGFGLTPLHMADEWCVSNAFRVRS